MGNLSISLVAGGEPFHGASPEERALGGSETAMVQMARALAGRGHRVTVFCNCPRPGDYGHVRYLDNSSLTTAVLQERMDVLVVSRFFPALDLPWQAGLKVLWNHDILDKPAELAKRLDQIDLCLVLSQFHASGFSKRLPAIHDKLALTANGLDMQLIQDAAQGIRRAPGRVVYASRPERGLKLLLKEIWPRLSQCLPGLELHVCGYQVDQTILDREQRALQAEIDELINSQPGVIAAGALAKREYYRLLASSDCLLYPCTFPEISCIAALEAQALATPVLTSDSFALSETIVTPEFLVPGRPGSGEYIETFIDRAQSMLGKGRERALTAARQAAGEIRALHDWQAIAGQWEKLFQGHLDQRIQGQPQALAAGLALSGDRLAAGRLLGQEAPSLDEVFDLAPDPKGSELAYAMAKLIKEKLPPLDDSQRIKAAILSGGGGQLAKQLDAVLPFADLTALEEIQDSPGGWELLILHNYLERQPQPQRELQLALSQCQRDGLVLISAASGAWPLISPGQAGRYHDLGREQLQALLPGRDIGFSYQPRGLVRAGAEAYGAGWWLALAPVGGPLPQEPALETAWRGHRPAPDQVVREVKRAGII